MAGVGLTGKIEPLNGGAFPVFEDINGQGGYRAVADLAARNAIPANSRKIGMAVVTQDDGVQYSLNGGITNADWVISSSEILTPLSSVIYVDSGTTTTSPDGSIGAPYSTITAALAAAAALPYGTMSFVITAGDYNAEAPVDLPQKNLVFWGLGSNVNGYSGNVNLPDFNSVSSQSLSFHFVNTGVITDLTPSGAAYIDLQYSTCQGIVGRAAGGTTVNAVGMGNAIGNLYSFSNLSTLTINSATYFQFGFGNLTVRSLTLINANISSFPPVQGFGGSPNIYATGTTFGAGMSFTGFSTAQMDNASYASFVAAGCTINCPITLLDPSAISFAQLGSGATTIDWRKTQNVTLTLTANATASFTPPWYQPANLILWVVQGGAGTYTLTLPGTCRTPGGSATAAAITTGVGARDKIALNYDGTNYFWTAVRNYLP